MTANRQHAGYLAVLLLAVTALLAGLVALWSYPIAGVILILSALALTVESIAELCRIKRLEPARD